ncbi:MAG: hypothetical protein IKC51_05320 [Myxococcaceae bacterium]|nr:hypothetical protein [Myxococcaceae bacterium]
MPMLDHPAPVLKILLAFKSLRHHMDFRDAVRGAGREIIRVKVFSPIEGNGNKHLSFGRRGRQSIGRNDVWRDIQKRFCKKLVRQLAHSGFYKTIIIHNPDAFEPQKALNAIALHVDVKLRRVAVPDGMYLDRITKTPAQDAGHSLHIL